MSLSTIDQARQAVEVFRSSLPHIVEARSFTLESKNPFKAMVLREAMIHRVSSLADGAVSEFQDGRWVSATVLVRAIVETTAVLHSLELCVSRALDKRNDDELTEFLRRTMVASRSEPDLPEAISVLTLIDKVDKDFPGFRRGYDQLSEYSHPNWCGALGAFSDLDQGSYTVSFAAFDRSNARSANIAGLMGALVVAQHVYNSSGLRIVQLSEAFDRRDIAYDLPPSLVPACG
jgi:hypothetical protein